jgi:hypothetical protein
MFIAMIMSGINALVTSIFPLQAKSKMNAGLIAGLIDGFCYVGSAISLFGL